MDTLFVFVEGNDDERFFNRYFQNAGINFKIIQYASMSKKEFTNYLKSVSDKNYIIQVDADGVSIEKRKEKFATRHPVCDISKIFITQQEIESWYIAGLKEDFLEKYKIKCLNNTDNLSKEGFEILIPRKYNLLNFKIEALKFFDQETAKRRNTSFRIFATIKY